MGKYDAVIRQLSELPPEDTASQQKINEIKAEIRAAETHTPESLAKTYLGIRAEKDTLKDELSEVQQRLTAVEQLLAESHDTAESGWGTHGAKDNAVRLASGVTIAVQREPAAKVEDKEAFRRWCVAPPDVCMICGGDDERHHEGDGLDHPFKPGGGLEKALQLWPATMNALTKERLLAGEPEPDGVRAFFITKIIRRGAGEAE